MNLLKQSNKFTASAYLNSLINLQHQLTQQFNRQRGQFSEHTLNLILLNAYDCASTMIIFEFHFSGLDRIYCIWKL